MLPDVDPLHRGISFDRTDTGRSNPRERVFAEAWNKENTNDPAGWSLLDKLCGERDPDRIGPVAEPVLVQPCTERDHWIAASVIQWLGSNCGQDFVIHAQAAALKEHAKWRIAYDAEQKQKHERALREISTTTSPLAITMHDSVKP